MAYSKLVFVVAALLSIPASQASFRSGTAIVPLYVHATDNNGQSVPHLRKEDFELFVDGQRVPIEIFSDDPGPTSILALFQTGFTGREYQGLQGQTRVRAVATQLVQSFAPTDELRLATAGAEIAVSPIATANKAILLRVIDEEFWVRSDYSPLYDAVESALRTLSHSSQRKVLLVFSNGISDAHRGKEPLTSQGLASLANELGVTVYAIGLTSRGVTEEVRELARQTGGGWSLIADERTAEAGIVKLLDEIRPQYVLGFSPAKFALGRHEITVRCSSPTVRLRARLEYSKPVSP